MTRVVPYMRVANVQDGFLDLEEVKSIEAHEGDISKLVLKHGDVLMTEGGDFDKLGRGARWQRDIPDCIHQNHVFRVRVNREIVLPEYFDVFLRTFTAKSYFLSCAKKTSNLASINITQLKALPVPVPCLETQRHFASKLQQLQNLTSKAGEHKLGVNNLFQSLIQRAFQGNM